ncbi:MAG: hypothetical protein WKF52_05560 [Sphingomicrobium sp.]
MTNYNTARRSFAVLDIEVLSDRQAYATYAKLDPRAADLRWPFRRVCSASLLTFSVTEDGMFEFGHMDSYADADEKAVITKLFNRLRELPDHVCVTWSGLSHDLPILRMSAAIHEIILPRQLIHNARDHGRYRHLDLAVELKAHGTYTHLSEIAVALNLPCKFGGSAGRVPVLVEQKRWSRLMELADSDVIVTGMVLCSHLCIHGALVSATAAHITLLDEIGRRRREAKYHDYLVRVRARIARRAMADAEAFIASAA